MYAGSLQSPKCAVHGIEDWCGCGRHQVSGLDTRNKSWARQQHVNSPRTWAVVYLTAFHVHVLCCVVLCLCCVMLCMFMCEHRCRCAQVMCHAPPQPHTHNHGSTSNTWVSALASSAHRNQQFASSPQPSIPTAGCSNRMSKMAPMGHEGDKLTLLKTGCLLHPKNC